MPLRRALRHRVAARLPRLQLRRHLARAQPARRGQTAYIDDHGTLTYGELDDQVRRLAGLLARWACGARSACCCSCTTPADWPVAFSAASSPASCRWRSTRCSPPTTTPTCCGTAAPGRRWCRARCCRCCTRRWRATSGRRRRRASSSSQRRRCRRAGRAGAARIDFDALARAPARRCAEPAPHACATTPRSGSIPPARPAGPRARCTPTPTCTGPRSSTARRCSA